MKDTRRIKRMARNKRGVPKINLTSLMDVFTILVFFLLVNSGQETMDAPNDVVLPESTVDATPKETVVIFVSPEQVVVQGQPVVSMDDVLATRGTIEPISKAASRYVMSSGSSGCRPRLARPKSRTFTWPRAVIMMLPGLMSR